MLASVLASQLAIREIEDLAAYFMKMPEPLVHALYRSLGGGLE